MLKFDEHMIESLEAVRKRQLPVRIRALWNAHADALGAASEQRIARLIDDVKEEAGHAGVDTAERLFLLAAAKALMPAMDGGQYLLALDEVFRDAPLGHRIAVLAGLAGRNRRDGY